MIDVDLGLTILRVFVGMLIAGHGAQKLFGLFGGPGLSGTTGMMGSLGLKSARAWALLAATGEFFGGVLLTLGLLNPAGALLIAGAMLMAIFKVHWPNGQWVTEGGYEYPLTMLVVVLVLGYFGPGRYALDGTLDIALPMPLVFWAGLVGVLVVTAVGVLSGRKSGEPAAPDQG
jgi:putative oxidoreductase